ncbi:unnamed protein product [Zymoseptoria tritici ST99CH_1A5]|uniref:Uncharacterized protein n=1 Tax=Zymoseptoria tritici ST99CH_1A5 TaxID=1276529 RepID=A0A1Y6L8D8_ZYMTR|nr:unnamed protein product [Zymoseptoria tritici ST99CH_1A5]
MMVEIWKNEADVLQLGIANIAEPFGHQWHAKGRSEERIEREVLIRRLDHGLTKSGLWPQQGGHCRAGTTSPCHKRPVNARTKGTMESKNGLCPRASMPTRYGEK